MLEQPSLLLRTWIHSFDFAWPKTTVQGAAWIRPIVNPTTNQILGFAAWDTLGWPGLLTWLGRKKIQVFETDDQSHLMTLFRPWGIMRSWEVLDAEERRVGHLFRESIYDGYGVRLATMSLMEEGGESLMRDVNDLVLGSWQDIAGQGRYIRFGESMPPNPFLRMVTLAAVLAMPPWPGHLELAARPAI